MARLPGVSGLLQKLPMYVGGALFLLCVALFIVLLSPLILLVLLLNILGALLDPKGRYRYPGGRYRPSASEVAKSLREFLDETGERWDWDDFISTGIDHPALGEIQRRATAVDLPLTPEGRALLEGLLIEAERLAKRENDASRFLTK